jgi:hypothetical protein
MTPGHEYRFREHDPNCPRFQFWDAGEWEAPCTCDDRKPGLSPGLLRTLFYVVFFTLLIGAALFL